MNAQLTDGQENTVDNQQGRMGQSACEHQVSRRGVIIGTAAFGVSLLVGSNTSRASASESTAANLLASADDTGPRVVYETSFEDPSDTNWLSDFTTYDASQVRTGSRSLRYTLVDPDAPAPACLCSTDTFPGGKVPGTISPYVPIAASVWVKADFQAGAPSIALEWYAEDGSYLTGAYTGGAFSNEWERLTVPAHAAPQGAAYMKVIFYAGYGAIGTAWFDDLTVTQEAPRLMRATLASPAYRGLLIPGEHSEIDLRVGIFPPFDGDASDYRVNVELADADGRRVDARSFDGGPRIRYKYSIDNLDYGDYEMRVVASRRREVLQEKAFALRRLRDDEVPTTYMDARGRTRHNGELFFPLGAFNGPTTSQNLEDLQYASFNTVLSYHVPSRDILTETHDRGMKTLMIHRNADAGAVLRYKDEPSLLGWYINDELPPETHTPVARPRYESVVNNDSNHPTYSVDFRVWVGDDAQYITDVFGTDPYAVKGKPGDLPNRYFTSTAAVVEELQNTAVWPVVQLHNLGNYGQLGERPPNLAEVRSMSWQAIVAGATGLLYYSRFDLETDSSGVPYQTLLDNAKIVVSEISSLAPVILSAERVRPINVTADDDLRWTTRRSGDHDYLFVVNLSKEARSISFTTPLRRDVRVLSEDRSLSKVRGTYSDTFEGLGVHLYQLPPR